MREHNGDPVACNYHSGLNVRLSHLEERMADNEKRMHRMMNLLIANLLGIIVILITAIVRMVDHGP